MEATGSWTGALQLSEFTTTNYRSKSDQSKESWPVEPALSKLPHRAVSAVIYSLQFSARATVLSTVWHFSPPLRARSLACQGALPFASLLV